MANPCSSSESCCYRSAIWFSVKAGGRCVSQHGVVVPPSIILQKNERLSGLENWLRSHDAVGIEVADRRARSATGDKCPALVQRQRWGQAETPTDEDASAEAARSQDFRRFAQAVTARAAPQISMACPRKAEPPRPEKGRRGPPQSNWDGTRIAGTRGGAEVGGLDFKRHNKNRL